MNVKTTNMLSFSAIHHLPHMKNCLKREGNWEKVELMLMTPHQDSVATSIRPNSEFFEIWLFNGRYIWAADLTSIRFHSKLLDWIKIGLKTYYTFRFHSLAKFQTFTITAIPERSIYKESG